MKSAFVSSSAAVSFTIMNLPSVRVSNPGIWNERSPLTSPLFDSLWGCS